MYQNDTTGPSPEGMLSNYVPSLRTEVGAGIMCSQSETLIAEGTARLISIGIVPRESAHICTHPGCTAIALKK